MHYTVSFILHKISLDIIIAIIIMNIGWLPNEHCQTAFYFRFFLALYWILCAPRDRRLDETLRGTWNAILWCLILKSILFRHIGHIARPAGLLLHCCKIKMANFVICIRFTFFPILHIAFSFNQITNGVACVFFAQWKLNTDSVWTWSYI